MPRGVPRWIRLYDNGGESADRYCVVFTNRGFAMCSDNLMHYVKTVQRPLRIVGETWYTYLSMSEDPAAALGASISGQHTKLIDRPTYGHLGRCIQFKDLPAPCKKRVREWYVALWDLRGARC